METALVLSLGALGFLALGSFTNVVIDRLPLALEEPNRFGETWDTRPWPEVFGGRSRCSDCGTEVRPIHNVPVLSYLALRGRCNECGERIPGFHLWVELAAGVLFVWAVVAIGWSWLLLPPLVVLLPGLAIAVIDLRTLMVPTRLVWPSFAALAVACVVSAAAVGEWGRLVNALIGLAVLAGPMFAIWFAYPRGMGFGDVRLAVLLGPLVGFASGTELLGAVMLALVAMAASALLGLVIGVGALGARGRKAKVPFGPSMILGAWICALYAEQILGAWELYSVG